jgi:Arc/MetJ-type ribon-helix-helix transcriptional regulator
MKLSVSLPDVDVSFLDDYAEQAGLDSRSAVLQRAVALLRAAELADDYTAAFTEWAESPDSTDWDLAGSDGLPT